MHRSTPFAASGVWVLLIATSMLSASTQAGVGAIEGVVRDASGAVLPGATIVATSETSRRQAVTRGDGRYWIDDLTPGTYRVEARFTGFRIETSERVVVEAGRARTWDPVLQIAQPSPAPEPVETFIERLIGRNARDCGQHDGSATVEALKPSVACAREAGTNRVPFSTIQRQAGIDSWIAQGLLGGVDGVVFLFDYDSSPCGNPGRCAARFTVTRCSSPSAREWVWVSGGQFFCESTPP